MTRSRLDPSRGVNFHAVLLPDTVYIGQQATYQIGVFLNQEVRQRLRRNPEFIPPETRALLVYDLPDAKAPLVGTIGGRSYEVHVFQRAFFALSAGRYDIPPSKLTYTLPQSASFFSREDTHSLRSEALVMVVLPIPAAGRPADWGGAVGLWRARLRVDSASGRVGDPLVVTLRIEGQGNVTLIPRPRLSVAWGTVVPADERVVSDSAPAVMRGAKEFDWLLTPRVAGRQSVPPQRFSYFDPLARRFAVAATSAVDVSIAGGDAVSIDSSAPAPPGPPGPPGPAFDEPVRDASVLTIRATPGAAEGASWLRSKWFLALLLLAPLPAMVGVVARRERHLPRARSNAQLLADAGGEVTPDIAALRRLVHRALRDRLALDAGLALARGTLVAALRYEGVTIDTAARAEGLLRLLDAAAFGGDPSVHRPLARDLAALYAAVDAEARRPPGGVRRARHLGVAGLLLAAFVLPAGSRAQQDDEVARLFAQGRVAFDGGTYAPAARHFLDAAGLEPRLPDVWANAGTAAWMAADTARAVQGWQRALRLAPLDADLRSRLARARAVQDRGLARVPPVPVQLAPLLLVLAWGAGWGLLARRAWRRRPVALRAAWLTVGCAVLLLGAAWLDDIQRGTGLAIVVRPEPLRTLPVLGADLGPAPLTGEVARILGRQGAWAHVRLDGAREGWIATELLLPLGDD
ncbi:MAG TPA: hypothetical protein VIK25_16325 [Gemmatimonadaceae bacterium]